MTTLKLKKYLIHIEKLACVEIMDYRRRHRKSTDGICSEAKQRLRTAKAIEKKVFLDEVL